MSKCFILTVKSLPLPSCRPCIPWKKILGLLRHHMQWKREKKIHTHIHISLIELPLQNLKLEHLNRGVNERVSPFKSFTGSFLSQLNLFCHQNTLSIIFDAQRLYQVFFLVRKALFSFQCGTYLLKYMAVGFWEKKKREQNSKPSCPLPGRPLEARKILHSYFRVTLLPWCHPKTGFYRVPGMGNRHKEYAAARGPLIKILWLVSFMLFQITDTEQKERQKGP